MRLKAIRFIATRAQAGQVALLSRSVVPPLLPLYPPHGSSQVYRYHSTLNLPHDAIQTPSPVTLETSINGEPPKWMKNDPKELALPQTCPGCGALAQESSSGDAGYYSRSRKAIRNYLRVRKEQEDNSLPISIGHSASVQSVTENSILSDELVTEEEEDSQNGNALKTRQPEIPVCDRCHNLIYNAQGESISHPSVEDIADSIAESPFRRNHVYHVLDAADFPMSLIPNIFSKLSLAQPRSQNRRSRYDFSSRPSMSFIITRSDLLAPTDTLVDSMLPYFQAVLRKALGRAGQDLRLGNVHLVSAKRGWWTKPIKENIWKRGGGNWMVGKVNVGKSNLFEVLFPKGSGDRAIDFEQLKQAQKTEKHSSTDSDVDMDALPTFLPEGSLLPPPQPESPFPTLPLVSSLPGTTASPIRVPFGHKGELIDMPGLDRGGLEKYVDKSHRLDLVMTKRPSVTQHIIKPGQSLILGGGLVRITPELDFDDPSTTMLAYPFVPLDAHVTSTDKAAANQQQERDSGIKSILADGVGPKMNSAGIFTLDTDVTKARAGPLLRSGVPLSHLPFRIFSTDVLIEGVGWVELVCQIRRSRLTFQPASTPVVEAPERLSSPEAASPDISLQPDVNFAPFFKQSGIEQIQHEPIFPKVEVFSPRGKHVAQRQPLGAWIKWNEVHQHRRKATNIGRQRRPIKRG